MVYRGLRLIADCFIFVVPSSGPAVAALQEVGGVTIEEGGTHERVYDVELQDRAYTSPVWYTP